MGVTVVADVVVVGLGAMGAATLFQLARRGIDAVGIDQYAPPHDLGSSHGETRITRCAVGEGTEYVPLAQASHRIWREIEAETGAELLDECGCLILAPHGGTAEQHGKTDFVGRSIASAQAYAIPHEVLDGTGIRQRFPQILAPDDTYAILETGGGFVYPERCIATQLDLAQRSGARILRAAVSAVDQTGGSGGVRVVTSDGTVEAARAVVAAGAWAGPLLGGSVAPLLRVTRQVLHWFPVDDAVYAPGRHPTLIWMHGDSDAASFYGFPALPGSGLMKIATEQYLHATTPATVERAVAPAEAAGFYTDHLLGRFAGVGETAARSKVCLYTTTPDAGFLIAADPERPAVTVVSACSGHGFKHSAGIGEHVAALVAGAQQPNPAFALAARAA